ncbi:hypothetical protein GW17_00041623 [Ensete ventricosum]|nr:hypothetical protein GW17_00041623 [Ensete ventricosum]
MIKRFVESSPKVAEKIIGTLRSTNLAEEDLGNEELDLMSADLGSLALEDLLFDMGVEEGLAIAGEDDAKGHGSSIT